MPSFYEIPLVPYNHTSTTVINNTQYILNVVWDYEVNIWVMGISDINRVAMVNGIALVHGVDLLGQFAYLGLGVRMFISGDEPTHDNFGTGCKLYIYQ